MDSLEELERNSTATLAHDEGVGGRRPLPPDQTETILEAAKQIGSMFKAAGHRFALAGGVAAYAHGMPLRLSHDVDFCILREDAEAVRATLEAGGLRVYTPPEDWLIKAECRGAAVDLIFELAFGPVDDGLLARAPQLSVNSVRMPVLSSTDLVAGLISAFSEHHCDYGPVLPIARQLREQIDWSGLRETLGGRPMADAFFYLLERLDVIEPAANPSGPAQLVGLAPGTEQAGPADHTDTPNDRLNESGTQ
jgi:Uncharacterised nucleotidyltransferase